MNDNDDVPILAALNCANIQAVGGTIPATRVMYARKAVPLSITGSLPTMTPERKKNR